MAKDNSYLINYNDDNDESRTKGWSISQRFETIIIGDAYCGKTTYLSELIKVERETNSPITIADDNNKLEFLVEYKTKKAIFVVRDTANQEKFRSLTQTHYKKAQCAVLAFDVCNLESFYSLPKWYQDIFTYCSNQSNFAVVLVGLKRPGNNVSNSLSLVNEELIDRFQIEHEKIISYCFVDLSKQNSNLKEPFEILLKYFLIELSSGRRSIANIAFNNYSSIRATPMSPIPRDISNSNNNDDGNYLENTKIFNNKKKKENDCKCKCKCSIL